MSFSFFSNSRKRARDEDEDDCDSLPEVKRPYSLPFRTSPTTKHVRLFSQSKRPRPRPLFTQTVTPNDSEEELSPQFCDQEACQQLDLSAPVPNASMDWDMDMGDCQMMMPSPQSIDEQDTAMLSPGAISSPKPSPRTLLAPQMDDMGLGEATNTGRLPTPIYGHFQQLTPDSSPSCASESSSPSTLQSDKEIEYDQYLRSRRLPSPISEDEAVDFPSPSAMKTEPDPFFSGKQPSRLRTPARLVQPLAGSSPKHGKIMFSMGFRADCEMCRNRVPGHSNHVFRV